MGVPQIHMLEPNPHGVMVLGGGAFQRSFGHEGGALMDGICIFIKEAQRVASPLLPCEDTER